MYPTFLRIGDFEITSFGVMVALGALAGMFVFQRELRRAGLPGTKLRSRAELNRALSELGSRPARLRFEPSDHETDALVTAAGMRALAVGEPGAFAPEGLTAELARTEGWTFGIL